MEAPRDAFVDIPYVIASDEDQTVIVDLDFLLQVLGGNLVLRMHLVIGSILHQ